MHNNLVLIARFTWCPNDTCISFHSCPQEPILKDMKYWSIAAIDENSFAVGNGAGIDIIDHSGEVKRSKSK